MTKVEREDHDWAEMANRQLKKLAAIAKEAKKRVKDASARVKKKQPEITVDDSLIDEAVRNFNPF